MLEYPHNYIYQKKDRNRLISYLLVFQEFLMANLLRVLSDQHEKI